MKRPDSAAGGAGHLAGFAVRAIRARLSRHRIRHVAGDIRHVALVYVPGFRCAVPPGVELVVPGGVAVLKIFVIIFPAVAAVGTESVKEKLKESAASELHKEGTSDPVFTVAKIGTKARHHRSWSSGVSSRRSDTSRAGKVWHIRSAVVVLQAIGEVLAGHIVRSNRSIPCLELVSRVLREVRSSGRSRSSIDRRQKDQIPAWVVDAPAAQGQAVAIVVEPQTVINHEEIGRAHV